MVTDRPDPLSPADCDLRGYDFMPLFGQRLFGSQFYSMALQNPRAGIAAQKLWWEAWQQCPAGSLPNDDATLARMADFGTDIRAWSKAKSVALHNFILCSDGRLYHPLLCVEAIHAFARRQKDRTRKAKWRASKDGDGHASHEDVPRDTTWTERGQDGGRDGPVPADSDRTVTGQDRTALSERSAHARAHEGVKNLRSMPTLADPPARWFALADKTEVDNEEVERPVVGGWYLDEVARMVCEAARINGATRPVDWLPLIEWLREGIDPNQQIIPVVRKMAARPGYTPPRFLSYFNEAIREGRAA